MFADRRLLWILLIAILIILLLWALDHVFFPDLPIPAGVPPITK